MANYGEVNAVLNQTLTATTRAATTDLSAGGNHTLSDTSATITAFNGVAGVTYHVRCLGAGSITHHATDLIITQGLASITTAAGDTFDVEMLTATTCRIKNYVSASKILTPYSCVRVNTANGYGSTATAIRRFTTTVTNTGADITYADSAANGGSFTVNANGIYTMSLVESFTGVGVAGISLNTTQGTIAIYSITLADRLAAETSGGANYAVSLFSSLPLVVGDVIRIHNDGTAVGTVESSFVMARVA